MILEDYAMRGIHMKKVCSKCGANISLIPGTQECYCEYCGSRQLLGENIKEGFQPDGIIPFKIDKKQCVKKYQDYLNNYTLVAKSKKDKMKIIDIKGIYIPFYLYTYDTTIYSRGIYKSIKSREESYNILLESKQGMKFLIPQNASTKLKEETLNGLDEFEFNDIKEFLPMDLNGFFAELADKKDELAETKADENAVKFARKIVERNFSAKFEEGIFDCDLKIENRKYILVPVWLISLECEQERYSFTVNGQNGKFLNLFVPEDKKNLIKSAIKIFTFGNIANVILSVLMSLANELSFKFVFWITFILLEAIIIAACIDKLFVEAKPPKAFSRDPLINCKLLKRVVYKEKIYSNFEQYEKEYGKEEIERKKISIYKDGYFTKEIKEIN